MPALFRGAHARARKPNIIFILADDLGWADLDGYGNTFNETSKLHKSASQGMSERKTIWRKNDLTKLLTCRNCSPNGVKRQRLIDG
jgi:hypothetical protein